MAVLLLAVVAGVGVSLAALATGSWPVLVAGLLLVESARRSLSSARSSPPRAVAATSVPAESAPAETDGAPTPTAKQLNIFSRRRASKTSLSSATGVAGVAQTLASSPKARIPRPGVNAALYDVTPSVDSSVPRRLQKTQSAHPHGPNGPDGSDGSYVAPPPDATEQTGSAEFLVPPPPPQLATPATDSATRPGKADRRSPQRDGPHGKAPTSPSVMQRSAQREGPHGKDKATTTPPLATTQASDRAKRSAAQASGGKGKPATTPTKTGGQGPPIASLDLPPPPQPPGLADRPQLDSNRALRRFYEQKGDNVVVGNQWGQHTKQMRAAITESTEARAESARVQQQVTSYHEGVLAMMSQTDQEHAAVLEVTEATRLQTLENQATLEKHKREFEKAQAAEARFQAIYRDIDTMFQRLTAICKEVQGLATQNPVPSFSETANKLIAIHAGIAAILQSDDEPVAVQQTVTKEAVTLAESDLAKLQALHNATIQAQQEEARKKREAEAAAQQQAEAAKAEAARKAEAAKQAEAAKKA